MSNGVHFRVGNRAEMGVLFFLGKDWKRVKKEGQVRIPSGCAIAAVISQVGDLAASAIKRNHQVKDYGHLIPGHGGVLDRFDSMIFTAPAIYLVITLFG